MYAGVCTRTWSLEKDFESDEKTWHGLVSLSLLYVRVFRIVDQLYALLRHYRADGSSAFSFGTPVGFQKGGDFFIHNHLRMLLYYHSNNDSNGQEVTAKPLPPSPPPRLLPLSSSVLLSSSFL